jgi:5-methylcytosine-specific restriction endonuclease McrA
MRALDLKDQEFDRLVVEKLVKCDKPGRWWLCRCKCGGTVTVPTRRLRSGWTRSCGCLFGDALVERNHGKRIDDRLAAVNHLFYAQKKDAKRRGLAWTISRVDFEKLIFASCTYCGRPPSNEITVTRLKRTLVYSGLDRQDNVKGYTLANVVPCCKRCNVAKNNMTFTEWQEWVEDLARHFRFTNGWKA